MSAHQCPPRCHRCPDLSGDVMPSCDGGAVANALYRCTCKARPRSITTPEEAVFADGRGRAVRAAALVPGDATEEEVRAAHAHEAAVRARFRDEVALALRAAGHGDAAAFVEGLAVRPAKFPHP